MRFIGCTRIERQLAPHSEDKATADGIHAPHWSLRTISGVACDWLLTEARRMDPFVGRRTPLQSSSLLPHSKAATMLNWRSSVVTATALPDRSETKSTAIGSLRSQWGLSEPRGLTHATIAAMLTSSSNRSGRDGAAACHPQHELQRWELIRNSAPCCLASSAASSSSNIDIAHAPALQPTRAHSTQITAIRHRDEEADRIATGALHLPRAPGHTSAGAAFCCDHSA